MFQVNKNVCRGCGLCAEHCPKGAISLQWGQAVIDYAQCNRCRICYDICPQNAIMELIPVSRSKLQSTIKSLKQATEDILIRIERLKQNYQ